MESRIADTINTDVLNVEFTGMTYDGDELAYSTSGMSGQFGSRMQGQFGGQMMGGPGNAGESFDFESAMESVSDVTSYSIPGLVIEVTDNQIVGTLDNANIYAEATKYSTVISVKVDDVAHRTAVIEALNDAGYAYQYVSDLDVFSQLETTLEAVSNYFLVGFIFFTAAFIMFTMSKYVSEGVKEIGIYRAIGMKKGTVVILFLTQSILYVLIGYAIGLGLGFGLNLLVSIPVNTWFKSFLESTVSESFSVVNTVDSSIFLCVNWYSILIYTGILVLITFVVSIFPSRRAAGISPVEAIKSE